MPFSYGLGVRVDRPGRVVRLYAVVDDTTVTPVVTTRSPVDQITCQVMPRPGGLPDVVSATPGTFGTSHVLTITRLPAAAAGDSQIINVIGTYRDQNKTGTIGVNVTAQPPPPPNAIVTGLEVEADPE